jgi:pilus assembly protein Flp/PilA
MKELMRFLKDEEGVTAMEYGLIGALIACVIIAAVTLAGQQVQAVFNAIAAAISAGIAAGS